LKGRWSTKKNQGGQDSCDVKIVGPREPRTQGSEQPPNRVESLYGEIDILTKVSEHALSKKTRLGRFYRQGTQKNPIKEESKCRGGVVCRKWRGNLNADQEVSHDRVMGESKGTQNVSDTGADSSYLGAKKKARGKEEKEKRGSQFEPDRLSTSRIKRSLRWREGAFAPNREEKKKRGHSPPPGPINQRGSNLPRKRVARYGGAFINGGEFRSKGGETFPS